MWGLSVFRGSGSAATVAALNRKTPPLARSARTAARMRSGALLSQALNQCAVQASATATP